jgi:hypothetical protein
MVVSADQSMWSPVALHSMATGMIDACGLLAGALVAIEMENRALAVAGEERYDVSDDATTLKWIDGGDHCSGRMCRS